ncbi:MAG: TOBE domain-containing protein [Methanobacteriaceae archaeon]|jgi:molybdate transport system regulatory protein|nr:MAG: transcriptional regulator [Methanobacterium sp. BRmetb2]MCC7557209.1 TOBE domain-containing protein [Methanobacteriaceae archaeon]
MDRTKNEPQYRLKLYEKIILLDKRKFELLKYIDECGSIMQASKQVNIPYRSAHKYIGNLETDLNKSIVFTKRGGKGGGGESRLTETGKQILKEYRKVDSILKMHADVNEIEGEIVDINVENKIVNIYLNKNKVILPLRGNFNIGDKVLVLISPEDIFVMLEPHESNVRNVFEGKITSMKLKDHLVRLTVDLGDTNLFCDVTKYILEQLDLNLGKKVYIGFKAAAIAMVKI